jgi:putative transposon-encoded protein
MQYYFKIEKSTFILKKMYVLDTRYKKSITCFRTSASWYIR